MVKRIVLTGGPCAGKTTVLSSIEEMLTEKGYTILIVNESATELIKGGIKINKVGIINFQRLIIKYQLEKEKIYDDAVKFMPSDEKVVIIYDRGLMDNKAYVNNKIFKRLLKELNLKEIDLMDRYDMVIHLVTAADSKEKFYTLENNNARSESIDEAKELDKKTMNAWVGHSNLKIIDNSIDFESKINKTLDTINKLLGEPTSLKYQRKYLIDLNESNLDLNEDNSTKIDIIQTYIGNFHYEKRLRKRILNGEETYFLTVQFPNISCSKKVITNQKISKKEYEKIYMSNKDKYVINKRRYAFTKDKKYFKLDIFNDIENLAILEVDVRDYNETINIPSNIKVISEVTDNVNYNNYNIAKNNNLKVEV